MNRLTNEPGFAKVVVFKVDFDSSKDVLREWKVGQALMLVFGMGAVVPVLALAYGSRRAVLGRPLRVASVVRAGKAILGTLLLLVGVLAMTGVDKLIEAWMVEHMPDWLINLTTAI